MWRSPATPPTSCPATPTAHTDVFVRDLQTGAITPVSTDANGDQGTAAVSEHFGRRALCGVHQLASNLVPGDTNGDLGRVRAGPADRRHHPRLDRRERRSGKCHSYSPSISADGRYVAFASWASNLVPGDTNGISDVFVRDLQTGAITRVSTDANGDQGNSDSFDPKHFGRRALCGVHQHRLQPRARRHQRHRGRVRGPNCALRRQH